MLFKIGLPNPYEVDIKTFFSQMRIVIKACEKAYEEATKDLTDEEKEDYWLGYRLPSLAEVLKKYPDVELDNYHEDYQDIELHIGN